MEAQEQSSTEQQYIKGFNHGYTLAKHEPELATQLTAQPNEHNEYFKGFVGGKNEYEKEVREWAKGFSKGESAKDDRDKHQER